MMRPLIIAAASATFVLISVYIVMGLMACGYSEALRCSGMPDVVDYYARNLRGSLFAGFLTLGGFLLSLKTFIVVNMKKEVYDTPSYYDRWKQTKDRGEKIGSLYQPLKSLSESLHLAIGASVITSVAQFTIGLIGLWQAVVVCAWAAVFSITLLLICLFRIRSNLNTMFRHLEDAAEDAAKKEEAAARKASPAGL